MIITKQTTKKHILEYIRKIEKTECTHYKRIIAGDMFEYIILHQSFLSDVLYVIIDKLVYLDTITKWYPASGYLHRLIA
jgi:hypothetical protein